MRLDPRVSRGTLNPRGCRSYETIRNRLKGSNQKRPAAAPPTKQGLGMDWRDEELTALLSKELDNETQFTLGESIAESLPNSFAKPALGNWNQEVEAQDEAVPPASSGDQRLLVPALVLSLFMHAVLATLVFNARLSLQQKSIPDFVEIQLIPSNPLLVEEEVEVSAIAEEIIAESDLPEIEEVENDTTEEQVGELVEEFIEQVPTEIAEVIEPSELTPEQSEPVLPGPEIFIPSLVNVQDSLREIEQENSSRLWAYDCDALEEESELRTCNPVDRRNYEVVERNSTYVALNPVREISRGAFSLPTVASGASDLAARLGASDLPNGLSNYVIEQLEAGITHNSNQGNRVIENMEIMTENEAAAQARAIMNNPWAKLKERERQQRNVHAQ